MLFFFLFNRFLKALETFFDVSCYTVLMNKGVGSLVFGQVFKKIVLQNVLHISVTLWCQQQQAGEMWSS